MGRDYFIGRQDKHCHSEGHLSVAVDLCTPNAPAATVGGFFNQKSVCFQCVGVAAGPVLKKTGVSRSVSKAMSK